MKKTILIGSLALFCTGLNASWQDMAKNVLGDITNTNSKTEVKNESKNLNESTVSKGLKEALKVGVDYAVKNLSAKNGYLNNKNVKIPLPNNLEKVETIVRKAGGDKVVDDLILSMNNAATKAAPKTAQIFLNAIDKMGIEDAKKILNSNDEAATNYFKTNTLEELKKTIAPIVKESIKTNKVASYYDTFNNFYKTNAKEYVEKSSVMQYAKSFGVDSYLPSSEDENLDEFITNKAIDGLFKMIAEKEQEIRKNPLGQTSDLIKKIFG